MLLIAFLALLLGPIGLSAASYFLSDRASANWQVSDRSSAGVLPQAAEHPDALVRIYAARTVRWRGIVAVHSWIVFKETGRLPLQPLRLYRVGRTDPRQRLRR